MSWKLDKSCVSAVEFQSPCSECDDEPGTHIIILDFGSETVALSDLPLYCGDCAAKRVEEIRAMLPDPGEEEDPEAAKDREIAEARANPPLSNCLPDCSVAAPCGDYPQCPNGIPF